MGPGGGRGPPQNLHVASFRKFFSPPGYRPKLYANVAFQWAYVHRMFVKRAKNICEALKKAEKKAPGLFRHLDVRLIRCVSLGGGPGSCLAGLWQFLGKYQVISQQQILLASSL